MVEVRLPEWFMGYLVNYLFLDHMEFELRGMISSEKRLSKIYINLSTYHSWNFVTEVVGVMLGDVLLSRRVCNRLNQ